MSYKLCFLLILAHISLVVCNLEGPFLFWGPESLNAFKKPALKSLSQDDLLHIYSSQPCIVVFNNQDSLPLSGVHFPRLRKMVEGQNMLVLPQDFLDVHPDYVSNETQIFTLQGPWSERDAEITETFRRLEDIHGSGHVLGILGNSVSQDYTERSDLDYDLEPIVRAKRQAETEDDTTTEAETKLEPKTQVKYALYNASGSAGKGGLLYSSGWPVLREGDEEVVFSDPIGASTSKQFSLKGVPYYVLVVKFKKDSGTLLTLELSFKRAAGWWIAVGVEIKKNAEVSGLTLLAPADPPSAAIRKSYHCSRPLVFSSSNATLTFPDIQIEPFMDNTARFSDPFDCTGFTTVPIWSGVFVCALLVLILAFSLCMILDIKTMDRFDANRARCLVITVAD